MATPASGSADLHIHTTFSDGAPSPATVVARAIDLGLSVIAVTDHDSIDGEGEASSQSGFTRYAVGICDAVSSRQHNLHGLISTRTVATDIQCQHIIHVTHT